MKIYLDMDGVLADFEGTVSRILGPDYDWKDEVEKPMWGKVGEIQNVYELLDVLHDAHKLIFFLKTEFIPRYAYKNGLPWAESEVVKIEVLTAIPKRGYFPLAVDHKREWIERRIDPEMKVNFGPYAKDKQYYCECGDILIDDSEMNIQQWIAKGGIGILHKNTDDTIQQLRALYEEE